jgi:hypothetical protein
MIATGYIKGRWALTGIHSDDFFLCVVEDDSRSNSEATSLTCLAYVASMGDVDHATIRVRASRASAFFLHPPANCMQQAFPRA